MIHERVVSGWSWVVRLILLLVRTVGLLTIIHSLINVPRCLMRYNNNFRSILGKVQ